MSKAPSWHPYIPTSPTSVAPTNLYIPCTYICGRHTQIAGRLTMSAGFFDDDSFKMSVTLNDGAGIKECRALKHVDAQCEVDAVTDFSFEERNRGFLNS